MLCFVYKQYLNSNLFCCAKLVVKQGRKAMGLIEIARLPKRITISFEQHIINLL